MNVMQIGNVGPSAWATYTTEEHIRRSFEQLGHPVHPVMESQAATKDAGRVLRRHPIDLVVYTRTEGLGWRHHDALQLWDECRRRGIPTVSVHLDLFFGIGRRGVKVTRDNALFAVDHCFTADGDHDTEFAAAGIVHHWLPPAVVADECGVGTPRPEWAGEVAFVGSGKGYHSEWPRRRELVAALEDRYGDRLVRAGDGVTVREQALNDLYASVPVVAGDSLAPNREQARYWSDRIPECAGRGGVLVHPRIDAAAERFGDAVVWSEWDVDAQVDRIAEVAAWPPEQTAKQRQRAVDIVRGGHTYAHRVRTVLDTIGLGD